MMLMISALFCLCGGIGYSSAMWPIRPDSGFEPSSRLLAGALLAVFALLAVSAAAGAQQPVAPADEEPEPVDVLVQRPGGTARADLEFRLVVDQGHKGAIKALGPDGTWLHLASGPILRERDVTEAHVTLEPDLVHYAVTLYFNESAAARLAKATGDSYGSVRIATVVNRKVLIVATVMAPLSNSVMIADAYTREEATRLAEQLAP